jgi:hypothetical protein
MRTTSEGLISLLIRKGITPTGDRAKDLELAKSVMPKQYEKKDDPKRNK